MLFSIEYCDAKEKEKKKLLELQPAIVSFWKAVCAFGEKYPDLLYQLCWFFYLLLH